MWLEYTALRGDQGGQREGNEQEGEKWGRVNGVGASFLGEAEE
jgi:hypothetical protein